MERRHRGGKGGEGEGGSGEGGGRRHEAAQHRDCYSLQLYADERCVIAHANGVPGSPEGPTGPTHAPTL